MWRNQVQHTGTGSAGSGTTKSSTLAQVLPPVARLSQTHRHKLGHYQQHRAKHTDIGSATRSMMSKQNTTPQVLPLVVQPH